MATKKTPVSAKPGLGQDAQIAQLIAEAVAKTAAETAASVVKTAADTATALLAQAPTATGSMATDIAWIKNDISEIKVTMKEVSGTFVTKTEFDPIKRGFYLLVGLVIAALVGALMKVLLKV